MEIKLSFDYDLNDLMAFQEYFMKNSSQVKRQRLWVILVLPILSVLILLYAYSTDKLNYLVVGFLVVASLFWLLRQRKRFWSVILKRVRKMIESGDNTSKFGNHEIVMNDEGILHKEPDSVTQLNWNKVKKIEQTDSYFFLYDSATSAIIIPRNKVAAELDDLEKILKAKLG